MLSASATAESTLGRKNIYPKEEAALPPVIGYVIVIALEI